MINSDDAKYMRETNTHGTLPKTQPSYLVRMNQSTQFGNPVNGVVGASSDYQVNGNMNQKIPFKPVQNPISNL